MSFRQILILLLLILLVLLVALGLLVVLREAPRLQEPAAAATMPALAAEPTQTPAPASIARTPVAAEGTLPPAVPAASATPEADALRGLVLTNNGRPLAEIAVRGFQAATTTDAAGRFVLAPVATGSPVFFYPPVPLTETHTATYAPTSITYRGQTSVTVQLQRRFPNRIVRGRVLDAATGQVLTHTRQFQQGQARSLSAPGTYSLPLTADQMTQTLTLLHPGYRRGEVRLVADGPQLHWHVDGLQTQPCTEQPDAALCYDLLLTPQRIKAIYIPFNLLSQPETVRRLFDLVERSELNAVVVDAKGDRGFLAWESQVPQATALGFDGPGTGWMTLPAFIAEAHARDIYVIARLVVFKDNPLAFGNPDLAITYADGSLWLDGEGLAWTNPYRPEVWAYNIGLAKEIAAMGADEINLDYIRFPSDGNIGAIYFTEEHTSETRTTAIRSFATEMRTALSAYPVFLSADVFGLTVWVSPEDGMNIGQRVIDLAPQLDYLAPMVYPSTFIPGNLGLANPSAEPYTVIYRSQLAAQERVAPPTRVRPWLQGYWYSSSEMLLQKQAANDAASAGWMWWNSGGVYSESIFEPLQEGLAP